MGYLHKTTSVVGLFLFSLLLWQSMASANDNLHPYPNKVYDTEAKQEKWINTKVYNFKDPGYPEQYYRDSPEEACAETNGTTNPGWTNHYENARPAYDMGRGCNVDIVDEDSNVVFEDDWLQNALASVMICPDGYYAYDEGDGPTVNLTENNLVNPWGTMQCYKPVSLFVATAESKNPEDHGHTCQVAGNPINSLTGNKYQTETDFRDPRPDGLSFDRTYNSQARDGHFWTHTFERRLRAIAPQQLPIEDPVVRSGLYSSKTSACSGGWLSIRDQAATTDLKLSSASYDLDADECVLSYNGQRLGTLDLYAEEPVRRWVEFAQVLDVYQSDGKAYIVRNTEGIWQTAPDVAGQLSEDDTGYTWHARDDRVEFYDRDGKLRTITYPGGQVHTLSYNAQGQLLQVEDRFGRRLTFEYNAAGQMSAMINPAGQRYEYDYNTSGLLDKVTYPDDTPGTPADNPTRIYHYEDERFPDALTGITNENGVRFATWSYDDYGRAINSEHGGVDYVSLTYNPDSTVTETNALGKQSVLHYNWVNDRKKISSVQGQPSSNCLGADRYTTYDTNGHIDTRTDWNGNVTDYDVNDRGLVEIKTEAVGTSEAHTTTTVYHPTLRLPTQITAPGKTTTYVYDDANGTGNVLSKTETDTTGLCADGQGNGCVRTWSYTYTASGLLKTVDGPRTDINDITTYAYDSQGNRISSTNALNQITQTPDYDANGNVLTIIDPNGVRTELTYDARQRLLTRTVAATTADTATTSFTYDPVGNLTRIMQPNGAYLDYTYDDANRLTEIDDNLGNRITYTLDNAGNRIAQQTFNNADVLVQTQTAVFDELSRMINQIGADSQTTVYGYDVNGNNTSVISPKGAAATTTQSFDALNRLITIQDPINGASSLTEYNYDDQSNLTQVTDAEGNVTTYVYNGFGEVISQTSPNTGVTAYSYDNNGNRLTQTDARDITVSYSYDPLNRLTSIVYPDSTENISYTYDQIDNGNFGVGRLTQVNDESGSTAYHYDRRGNIIKVASTVEAISPSQTFITGYAYDLADNLIQISYPNGRTVDYIRNVIGQITEVTTTFDGLTQTLADNISYQPFGPINALTYGNGLTQTRQYDLDGRMDVLDNGVQNLDYGYDLNSNIEVIDDQIYPGQTQNFGYDLLDRLTDADGAYGNIDYGYDGVGNRVTLMNSAGTDTYAYSVGSQILDSISGVNNVSYQYDAVGNMTDNGTYAFSYNHANHLSSVLQDNEQIAAYRYNALGQRTLKVVGVEDTTDYAALAEEQEALATGYRDQAADNRDQADALDAQADLNEQQATDNQVEADALRIEAGADREAAEALQPEIDALEQAAQPWLERANRFLDKIVEPPQSLQDEIRNGVFTSVAAIFQATADVYLNQAESLIAEQQALQDGAAQKEQQAAELEAEAEQLLVDAAQARQEAVTLRTEADERIAQAEQAEALAEEYRQLAENPPQTQATTLFVYDPNGQLIGEYTETGNIISEYVYLNGQPLAQIDSSENLYYYHTDHLGTPKSMTDQLQQIVWNANYAPFGEADITAEDVVNNFRFPGQYFDTETNLHYNYFRYYDPSTGRYITSDPIGLRAGLNTYAYVKGNPLKYTDAYGLMSTLRGLTKLPGSRKQALGVQAGIRCASNLSCRSWGGQNADTTILTQCASDLGGGDLVSCIETCQRGLYEKCQKDPNACLDDGDNSRG